MTVLNIWKQQFDTQGNFKINQMTHNFTFSPTVWLLYDMQQKINTAISKHA